MDDSSEGPTKKIKLEFDDSKEPENICAYSKTRNNGNEATNDTGCSNEASTSLAARKELQKQKNHEEIIHWLKVISNQNSTIINLLRKKPSEPAITVELKPDFLNLPLKTEEELYSLESSISDDEKYQSLIFYLSKFGGKCANTSTNRILKKCLTNELATNFNYVGKMPKTGFHRFNLCKAILGAVKLQNPGMTDFEIEGFIKVWLKHAPQRFRLSKKYLMNESNKGI